MVDHGGIRRRVGSSIGRAHYPANRALCCFLEDAGSLAGRSRDEDLRVAQLSSTAATIEDAYLLEMQGKEGEFTSTVIVGLALRLPIGVVSDAACFRRHLQIRYSMRICQPTSRALI